MVLEQGEIRFLIAIWKLPKEHGWRQKNDIHMPETNIAYHFIILLADPPRPQFRRKAQR
jgi:hypothetical protein